VTGRGVVSAVHDGLGVGAQDGQQYVRCLLDLYSEAMQRQRPFHGTLVACQPSFRKDLGAGLALAKAITDHLW
jgi:hypothetical protein